MADKYEHKFKNIPQDSGELVNVLEIDNVDNKGDIYKVKGNNDIDCGFEFSLPGNLGFEPKKGMTVILDGMTYLGSPKMQYVFLNESGNVAFACERLGEDFKDNTDEFKIEEVRGRLETKKAEIERVAAEKELEKKFEKDKDIYDQLPAALRIRYKAEIESSAKDGLIRTDIETLYVAGRAFQDGLSFRDGERAFSDKTKEYLGEIGKSISTSVFGAENFLSALNVAKDDNIIDAKGNVIDPEEFKYSSIITRRIFESSTRAAKAENTLSKVKAIDSGNVAQNEGSRT